MAAHPAAHLISILANRGQFAVLAVELLLLLSNERRLEPDYLSEVPGRNVLIVSEEAPSQSRQLAAAVQKLLAIRTTVPTTGGFRPGFIVVCRSVLLTL
jgi:hypothetical protein